MKEVAGKGGANGGKSSGSTGTVIISQFPYVSLTDKEIISLYKISGFTLGATEEEQLQTVQCLKSLSKAQFTDSLSSVLSTKVSDPSKASDISGLILDTLSVEPSSTND